MSPQLVDAPAPPSSFASLKVATATNVAYPAFKTQPKTTAEYLARAKEVAALLALDVAQRENNNEVPYKQVQLLKDAGLVTALGPVQFGGGGQSFAIGYKLVREVAAGDGSVGQLLAYHYLWSYTATVVGTAEQIEYENKRYVQGNLFYGAAVNPRDSDLAVTESVDGKSLIFTGKKAFSTGSKISDLTVLEGVIAGTDSHVFGIVDSKQEGIKYGDDWKDVLGLRGSQSGSITITNVSLPWTSALGFNAAKEFVPLGAFNTLLLPTIQLSFVNFYLGIAQGALAKAATYTAANTRAWPFSGDVKEKAIDEFYIQEIYGTLQAKVWGLEAHADSVGELISELLSREDRTSVTAEERGNVAARIAGAKVTSTEIGLEVTSQVYEVLGARSIALKAGFSHFWHNIRTHTLHDPVAHKRAEVGRFVLTGEFATPTWYT